MTLPPFAYRRTYPLRHGFAVTFSLDGLQLQAEWSPDLPQGRQARKLVKGYRLARHRFIASLGVNALVVEL